MSMIVKRIAAVGVLLAFFLPLSQCSSRVSEESVESASTSVNQAAVTLDVKKESVQKVVVEAENKESIEDKSKDKNKVKSKDKSPEKNYAYKAAPWTSWNAFFMYCIFLWPCLLIFMLWRRPAWQEKLSVNVLEIMLALASILILNFFSLFYQLLIGAYLALAAWSLYGLAAASVLWQRFRLWRYKRSLLSA
jgi:cation transport ATPase